MIMKFTPLTADEVQNLTQALRSNAEADKPIYMDPKDTSFRGSSEAHDEEVIAAIRSVPCHY
jgi:hypothetical protein